MQLASCKLGNNNHYWTVFIHNRIRPRSACYISVRSRRSGFNVIGRSCRTSYFRLAVSNLWVVIGHDHAPLRRS